ncbi:hypothetical protein H9Q69_009441 [Fusarium xylarioides]|nr:hypothetical protein H9Q70_008007 [Fusarium xylarioides]KAG5777690.1 hypothetical protein H9Q73_008647 [Fusarium xylarioides]KAG5791500.1 hypothetical protein H9Q69_009441 [Fusarium xylarioides]
MIHAIPESLTTNGWFVPFNSVLSTTEKDFISIIHPRDGAATAAKTGTAVSTFNTKEVRNWQVPQSQTSITVKFFQSVEKPPAVAAGPNWPHITTQYQHPRQCISTLLELTPLSSILALGPTTISTREDALAWKLPRTTRTCSLANLTRLMTTQWNQSRPKAPRQINFARLYSSLPKAMLWLSQLEMDENKNCLDAWSDTILYAATAHWIACLSNKISVTSGTLNVTGIKPWYWSQWSSTGGVSSPANTFQKPPLVLFGFDAKACDRIT